MMVRWLVCLLLIASSQLAAQTWTFVTRIDVGQAITCGDVSTLGQAYFGTEKGNVYSYHPDGTPYQDFSSGVFAPVTDLDASNPLKLFVFYASTGEFQFLERFSSFPRKYNVGDFGINQADRAALDPDNTLWLVSGGQLICLNPFNRAVITRISLPNGWNPVSHLSVAEKRVISVKGQGVFLFEEGKPSEPLITTIGTARFDIRLNELVTLSLAGVMVYDLESGRTEIWTSPVPDAEFVLKSGSTFFFVVGERISIYSK